VSEKEFSIRVKDLSFDEQVWPCAEDKLGRYKEIESLTPLMINAQAPLVFCLDAPWGAGKTTFLRLWVKYFEKNSLASLYLNAWECDFAEDPLVPLICTIDSWVEGRQGNPKARKAWEKAKKYAPGMIKSTAVAAAKVASFGALDLDKELEKIAAELAGGAVGSIVDEFNIKKKSLEQFKIQLSRSLEALPDRQKNLVVFVDELDRCRPAYAIEVLERIKHLFDVDRVIFVLAMNCEQLGKSLQGVYGAAFDGVNYLKRFIDIDYRLRLPSAKEYLSARLQDPEVVRYFELRKNGASEQEHVLELLAFLVSRFDYTLRDINQLLGRLKLVLHGVPADTNLEFFLIIPLLVLRERNHSLYSRYAKDPGCANEVVEFLLGYKIGEGGIEYQLAFMSGMLLGMARDPYSRRKLNSLAGPWKEWSAKLAANVDNDREVAELRRTVDLVLEIIADGRRFGGYGYSGSMVFDRIELLGELGFS